MSESIPVGVTCTGCGKTYRWRQEFAGQQMRCRACNGVLVMPAEPPEAREDEDQGQTIPLVADADPYEIDQNTGQEEAIALDGDAKGPDISSCPSCGNPVGTSAAICVNCGFSIQEGRQLETAIEADDTEPGKKRRKKKARKAEKEGAEEPAAPKSIKQRLADRDDEAQSSKFIDIQLPLILLAIGLVVAVVQQSQFSGAAPRSLVQACIVVTAEIVITVPLLLVGLYFAAWVLGVSYGPLGIGLLKLTAIAVGPDAIGDIIGSIMGGGLTGWFVSAFVALIAYWILLAKMFDLDLNEAFETIILVWFVKFIAGLAALYLVFTLLARLLG